MSKSVFVIITKNKYVFFRLYVVSRIFCEYLNITVGTARRLRITPLEIIR